MKQNKDHIKDIFSSKLKGFEADLPSFMWDEIQADLPVGVSARMPIRKTMYRVFASVAAVAAIVIAIVYLMPLDKNNGQYIVKSLDVRTESKDRSFSQMKKDIIIAESGKEQRLKSTGINSVNTVAMNQLLAKNKIEKAEGSEKYEDVLILDSAVVIDNVLDDSYVADINEVENFQTVDSDFEQELQNKIEALTSEGENSKNLLADNSSSINQNKNYGSKGLSLGVEGGGGFSKANDVANSSKYANPALNGGPMTLRSQEYKLEHNQPVSFGVAVNKKITEKISIESGILYTYVSANIVLRNKPEYNQNDQQYFHYFGVPLSINYKFAEWKRADFYASLGGVVQKDFYGKIKSKSSIDDLLNTERVSSRDISQSKPQFSATGLVGVSYPLYKGLSAYASFGGAYYFDAKNEYETIFSDRKWLFNFNLGLKFGF